MELEVQRQLPYDVDIEQALLGAILIDNYSLDRASRILKPEHFYDPLHQRLFTAIERMWASGHIVTPLTLKAAMEQDPGLAEVGGQTYLVNLARAAPAIPNVKDYARILVDLAMRRELIRIGETIVNTAYEAPIELAPAAQIEEAEKALYHDRRADALWRRNAVVRRGADPRRRKHRKGAQGRDFRRSDRFHAIWIRCLAGFIPPISSSLPAVPAWARPSLATNMAFHAARLWAKDKADNAEPARGAPVLLFSLEMAAAQLSARILSEQTEIEMRKLRSGRSMTDPELERLVQTAQVLRDLPLYIDDTGGISIAQIAARARRLKREKQIGLIIVDYLQLVEAASRRFDNRVQEISEVTKG